MAEVGAVDAHGNAVARRPRVAVLRELVSGASDAATARACGISARQVGRELARLMEITGTTGRLALGAAAARRGWL